VTKRLAIFAVLAACFGATGCGGKALSCGAGTVEKGGKCVPSPDATACGAGTIQADGACYAPTSAAMGDAAPDAPAEVVGADVPDGTADVPVDAAADASAVACVPVCVGKDCGDDGCGGTCGTCKDPAKPFCDTLVGKCGATCIPECLGKNCGDDGCGGVCGTCAGDTDCSEGHCTAKGWTCKPGWYAAGDSCDCGCGVLDPDCADTSLPLAGCADLEVCDAKGMCVSKIPVGWTCPQNAYAALDACDCGCGVPDPDCKFASLPLYGCSQGDACTDGQCKACVPECTGKTCGADGCGGFCGLCADGKACDGGACVDPCGAKPLACKSATCGSDGCGGQCGTCPGDKTCSAGQCIAGGPSPYSCQGHCGSKADSGCSCTAKCAQLGTCCGDYGVQCTCTPDCAGKSCGSDGCGGSCGTCSGAKPYCGSDGQCTGTCKPQCTGKTCGDDGCGGQCGTCGAADTCAWTGKCVPKAWKCDQSLYGDQLGCDCGCGAQDPDCKTAKATVFGCPKTTSACSATGVCDVTFCSSNATCKNAWCTGNYYAGGGKYAGVCSAPLPGAAPGSPCQFGAQCATGVCLDGQCRQYCGADSECAAGQTCAGMPVAYGVQTVAGFAPVCTLVPGSTVACKAQADCKATNETCIALVDATTLGPRFLCAQVPKTAIGAKCGVCPTGQMCLPGGACTSFCPGGDGDCPSGWTCGKTALHGAGTPDPADDPQVAVCVPK
jgi:hypothetical protein